MKVTVARDANKEAFKLSFLAGVTHENLDNWIDNNVTDFQSAKEALRKLAHVVLMLAKYTKLGS